MRPFISISIVRFLSSQAVAVVVAVVVVVVAAAVGVPTSSHSPQVNSAVPRAEVGNAANCRARRARREEVGEFGGEHRC